MDDNAGADVGIPMQESGGNGQQGCLDAAHSSAEEAESLEVRRAIISEPPDVILVVEDTKLPCHRQILSKSMAYFQAMFSSNMKETRQESIEIQQVTAPVMQALLSLAYGETMNVTSFDQAADLLSAAAMFQFQWGMKKCVLYLSQQISHANCLDIMLLSDSCGVPWLYNQARKHALHHFCQVSQEESYLQLSTADLSNYLADSMLNCNSETNILDAVLKWTAYNVEERREVLSQTLQNVRLGCMTCEELRQTLEHTIIQQNLKGKEIVECALQCRKDDKRSDLLPKVCIVGNKTNYFYLYMD